MKQKLFRLMLMVLAVLMIDSADAKKVWMLGDSTMTEYDDSEPTGGRGWGMYFGNFLTNGWTHVNMAKGGRDSRGGYEELWASCKNDVEAGDYVIIQFAHNDASCGGIDYLELKAFYTELGDPDKLAEATAKGRGTNPSTTYKQMLKNICDEVRAKGATPILVSAVCRCYMQNGVVRRDGRHDIGGNYEALVTNASGVVEHKTGLSLPTDDHTMDYPYQMKQVALAEGVAFLDMTTATADLMASYEAQGTGNAHAVMFDKKIEANDGTHYNVTGALLAARLCAQLIQQEQSNYASLTTLANNIYVPTDMSFNPSEAAMGEVYVGQAATKEISLSALGLTPAEGAVTLTATNGILLSYDKQNWEETLSAEYAMGTLIKTFYVKVPITATGTINGTVTATLGDKSVELPVSVTGIELGGGDPFAATWTLGSNAQPTTTEGVSVSAANGLLAGLQANGFSSGNGWQLAETAAGAWNAARIDNIESEYVEFSITAPEGRTIDITQIAMQLKEQGGDHLHFHIKSSTDNFATETSLFGFQSASDAWTEYTKSVNVKLEEGQTLKVRVYPWSDAVTTGNWLCIKDVVISGQSKDANGVNISGTITYTMDKGGLNQGDDVVMNPETLAAGIAYKSWSAGSALIVKGTATYQGAAGDENIVQTAILNDTGNAYPNTGGKDYTLTLTLTPDYGFQFVPTKVSFQAARYGTGSGRISASIGVGETQEVLFNDADVNRSGQNLSIASFTQSVTTSMTATADNSLKLNFWFPGLNGDGHTMGISNVVVEGTLVGAPETVTKYLLNTSVVPADGGTITRTPALDMYKEGAQVKLTASPASGYQFVEWQDGNGAQVATTAETTITMDAQKTMKAVFELLPVEGIEIPTPDGEYISWKDATLENCKIENNGDNVGSTGANTTVTFYINNSVKQDYILSFFTGAKNLTAKLNVNINNGANTYLNETVDIENTGAWDLTQEHTLGISQLPAGSYTLKFTVVSTTGSYAGNWGRLAIRKGTIVDTPKYTLTAECNPADGGTVTPNGKKYEPGTEVKLTATANPYYTFQKWDDETTNTERTITMPEEDKTVTAYFQAAPLTIPTTDVNPFYTEWADCSNGNWNGNNLDSFRSGGTATYTITNTQDCSYILKYQAASANDGVQVKMQLKQDGNVIWEETKDVENTGNWQSYKDYEMNTTALTQGEYTFVVTFLRADGGYTTNVKDIQFKADLPIVAGQMLSLSIDGIAMGESVLNPLVAEGHSATIAHTLTSLPVIVATFDGVDGAITMSNVDPTIEGNTLTYVKTISEVDYTFTFTNYHPYAKTENDETVQIKYSNEGKQADGTWSNGLYTLASVGDGWPNSSFKMNQGDYTWYVPSDVVVKQMILKDFNANYNGGSLTSCTSEGATVYVPFKHDYQEPDETMYDLIINLDNHQAGTPITFNLTGGGQPVAWFEFTVEHVNPGTAPQLNSKTVSVENNHAIVAMTFDREMQDVEASVGEQTVKAEGGSATIYFPVWNLDWSQTHTLTIAAGAAKDQFGNGNAEAITADIVIDAKPVAEQKAYDYVVGTVDELQAAIAAVNESNKNAQAERKTIFVKNGDYALPENWKEDGTHDRYMYDIYLSCYNVSFIGQSKEGVIIHALSKGITSSTLNMGSGTGNYFENLTVRNDADFGVVQTAPAGVCVAVTGGNKTILKNVAMQSNQDTYVTGARTYLVDCDIHGTVDFICGGGDIFFDHNNLILEDRGEGKGDVISAPSTSADLKWGYVFDGCTVKSGGANVVDGSYSLGRPWQNEPRANYLNTIMEVQPSALGWSNMSNLPTHFYEYNSMDKDGNAIDLSGRGNSPSSTNHYTPVLTDEEAARFTVENVLCGTDSWLPTDYTATAAAPVCTVSADGIAWTAVEDARCYVITDADGEYLTNITTTSYQPAADGTYYIYSTNAMGGLGQCTKVDYTSQYTGIETITGADDDNEASYNIAGQRVSRSYKGIVIINGRKVVVK